MGKIIIFKLMPVITAINWTLLAFAPVFIGHICLVSPLRTQTTVRAAANPDHKKGSASRKETVVNEKIDYAVAWNGALAYLASIVIKITAQAIIMPLFMTGDSEVRDVDDKLQIDYVYHILRAILNVLFDVTAFWVVLSKAFSEGSEDASYH